MIVQNLADAANLEDALEAEEFEVIDVHQLVQNYLQNCRSIHRDREFRYQGVESTIRAAVSDFRSEQLLDKLIDNAVDFSETGSTITVGINTDADFLALFITNQGPTVTDDQLENICLLYTSPSPRDGLLSRMPSSA